jgi:hypothetical protein
MILSRRRLLGLAGATGIVAVAGFSATSHAARKPTDAEVAKFKKAWNAHLNTEGGEKPLTDAEAREILTQYMKDYPDLSVDQIIKKFVAANR